MNSVMELVEKAIQHLTRGGVIAYPTETVWGLGVDVFHPGALDRLYKIKNRPREKAVSVLTGDVQHAKRFVFMDAQLETFLNLVWPGPVTVVLPCLLPDWPFEGIGLRCPKQPFVQQLAKNYVGIITTTSCNLSGHPPAQSIDDLAWLPDDVLICQPSSDNDNANYEDVPCKDVFYSKRTLSQGSTVVRWHSQKLQILRQGDMPAKSIEQAFRRAKGLRKGLAFKAKQIAKSNSGPMNRVKKWHSF